MVWFLLCLVMLLYNSSLIYKAFYWTIFAFIARNEDFEAQGQEDNYPPDSAVSQFSFKHNATQTVPEGVNKNSITNVTHFCPEDTKV